MMDALNQQQTDLINKWSSFLTGLANLATANQQILSSPLLLQVVSNVLVLGGPGELCIIIIIIDMTLVIGQSWELRGARANHYNIIIGEEEKSGAKFEFFRYKSNKLVCCSQKLLLL